MCGWLTFIVCLGTIIELEVWGRRKRSYWIYCSFEIFDWTAKQSVWITYHEHEFFFPRSPSFCHDCILHNTTHEYWLMLDCLLTISFRSFLVVYLDANFFMILVFFSLEEIFLIYFNYKLYKHAVQLLFIWHIPKSAGSWWKTWFRSWRWWLWCRANQLFNSSLRDIGFDLMVLAVMGSEI